MFNVAFEPEVKEQAEQVLDQLGIPMSNAVGMFLRQIVLQRGIPFEVKLPAYEEPVAYGSLTKERLIIGGIIGLVTSHS